MPFRRLAALVALSIVASGGAAYAAGAIGFVGSDGKIRACVQKSSGQVRLVDTPNGKPCGNSEIPVEWAQSGARGPAGPQGPAGPKGARGPSRGAGEMCPTAESLLEPSCTTTIVAPANGVLLANGTLEAGVVGQPCQENFSGIGVRISFGHSSPSFQPMQTDVVEGESYVMGAAARSSVRAGESVDVKLEAEPRFTSACTTGESDRVFARNMAINVVFVEGDGVPAP